jgi:hypothetical protein
VTTGIKLATGAAESGAALSKTKALAAAAAVAAAAAARTKPLLNFVQPAHGRKVSVKSLDEKSKLLQTKSRK